MFRAKDKTEKQATLNEKEIQQRLYGKFITPHGAGQKYRGGSNGGARTKPVEYNHETLFDKESVSEIKSAVVSKLVLEESRPKKSPPNQKPSVIQTDWKRSSFSKLFNVFKQKKSDGKEERGEKTSARSLPTRDLLTENGKLNFGIEMEEWKERLKKISVWHIVTVLLVLAGVLVLFNVFVNLTVERNLESLHIRNEPVAKPAPADFHHSESVSTAVENSESPDAAAEGDAVERASESVLNESANAQAGNRDSATSAASKEAEKIIKSASAPEPVYAIQICIYENEKTTNRMLTQLEQEGYKGLRYDKTTTSSGRSLYRLFYGNFSNFKEAQEGMVRFRRDPLRAKFPDSFIRSVK